MAQSGYNRADGSAYQSQRVSLDVGFTGPPDGLDPLESETSGKWWPKLTWDAKRALGELSPEVMQTGCQRSQRIVQAFSSGVLTRLVSIGYTEEAV